MGRVDSTAVAGLSDCVGSTLESHRNLRRGGKWRSRKDDLELEAPMSRDQANAETA